MASRKFSTISSYCSSYTFKSNQDVLPISYLIFFFSSLSFCFSFSFFESLAKLKYGLNVNEGDGRGGLIFLQLNCLIDRKQREEQMGVPAKDLGNRVSIIRLINQKYFKPTKFLIIIYKAYKRMDLGWLAESSLVPSKAKQIKVNETYQVGLKIAMGQIQKLKNKQSKGKPVQKKIKRNKGIEQRNKKDQQSITHQEKLINKNYYKSLEKKAAVYEQIDNKRTNVAKLLVDFEAKSLLMDKDQEEDYEQSRKDFYSGKLAELTQKQRQIHQNIQTENIERSVIRQNTAWEIEMMNELKNDQIESGKPKVQQSFDNKLSRQQKQALNVVVDENQEQKEKLEKIKKRREVLEQERIRKLRKLNDPSKYQNQ